jgi:NADPH:quinone reductase-like Zn-dependent oxidoreductase
VRKLTAKRGVDVIVDHVGQDTWAKNIASLARAGVSSSAEHQRSKG